METELKVIKKDYFNKFPLTVYGTIDKPLFEAKQVGEILELKCIRSHLRIIPKEYKFLHVGITDTNDIERFRTFITEPALYQLAFRSNKKEALKFTDWVCSEVLPSIRKTGKYDLKEKKYIINEDKRMYITNEASLQKEVIKYLRTYKEKYNLVITTPLGELQDTEDKRINSYYMGYDGGNPDIIIHNPTRRYNGLVIELKAPKGEGELSDKQNKMLDKYKEIGYKVIVSNDYSKIIRMLTFYFYYLRVCCKYCSMKFKSTMTRNNHYKYFHKIDNDEF